MLLSSWFISERAASLCYFCDSLLLVFDQLTLNVVCCPVDSSKRLDHLKPHEKKEGMLSSVYFERKKQEIGKGIRNPCEGVITLHVRVPSRTSTFFFFFWTVATVADSYPVLAIVPYLSPSFPLHEQKENRAANYHSKKWERKKVPECRMLNISSKMDQGSISNVIIIYLRGTTSSEMKVLISLCSSIQSVRCSMPIVCLLLFYKTCTKVIVAIERCLGLINT